MSYDTSSLSHTHTHITHIRILYTHTHLLRHTFPKAAIRFQRVPRRRPLHHAIHQDAPGDTVASDPGKASIPPPSLPVKQQRRDKRKGRPMAGRKNKEAREKAIEDHRAVRGFKLIVDLSIYLHVSAGFYIWWQSNKRFGYFS